MQVFSRALLDYFLVQYLPLLLGDESKVSLLGLGALEPLCQLIAHNNKLVRRNAFMALGTMATNGESDHMQHIINAVLSTGGRDDLQCNLSLFVA